MLNPDGAWRFRNEGSNRWRLGDYDRAESLLLRAVELNPGDYEALRRLTQLHLTQRRLDEARDVAARMLAVRPDRSESHSQAAIVEAWAGHPREAFDHLERGAQLSDAGGIVLTSRISWPTLRAFALAGVGRESGPSACCFELIPWPGADWAELRTRPRSTTTRPRPPSAPEDRSTGKRSLVPQEQQGPDLGEGSADDLKGPVDTG